MMPQNIFWTNAADPFVRIEKALKNGEIIEGLVRKVDKTTLNDVKREYVTMDLGGIDGICPDDEFDAHSYKTLSGFIGHTVSVIVMSITEDANTGKKIAIVSRRLAEEKKGRELLQNLKEGDIVNGTISGYNEEKKTIFINIGGHDAFCYLDDWDHVRTPTVRDAGPKGMPVTVYVSKIVQDPLVIRVSRKDASKDPWDDIEKEFPVDSADVLGVVTNVSQQYGIFVRIKRGVTLLATLPQRSRLPLPEPGTPVRGTIKWLNPEQRKGKFIITSYPHGAPLSRENPGSYLFD